MSRLMEEITPFTSQIKKMRVGKIENKAKGFREG
jgi:hypothetical protein